MLDPGNAKLSRTTVSWDLNFYQAVCVWFYSALKELANPNEIVVTQLLILQVSVPIHLDLDL